MFLDLSFGSFCVFFGHHEAVEPLDRTSSSPAKITVHGLDYELEDEVGDSKRVG